MTEIRTPEPAEHESPLLDDGAGVGDQAPFESKSREEEEGERKEEGQRRTRRRTTAPTPNASSRRPLTFFAIFVVAVWLAYAVHKHRLRKQKSQIVYASRYSKDHKFRPAASPIITETLKDGRIRLRGATPPPETPTPTPTPRKRRTRKGKRKGGSAGGGVNKGKTGRKGKAAAGRA